MRPLEKINTLPDRTPLPTGAAGALMYLFDFWTPTQSTNPRGRAWLKRELGRRLKEAVSDNVFDDAINRLVAGGLVRECEPVKEEEPRLPGMPDIRMDFEPIPGEPRYEATYKGLVAARACLTNEAPTFAFWQVGESRLEQATLLAIHHAHREDLVYVALFPIERSKVEAALNGLCGSGFAEISDKAVRITDEGQGPLSAAQEAWIKVMMALASGAGRTPIPVQVNDLKHQLGFVANNQLLRVLERDIEELDVALPNGLAKTALVLCGSILEGLLFDVLDRNRAVASSYTKNWPDRASLPVLINAASGQGLLSGEAKTRAAKVTQHRDLIHPWAELRDGLSIDVPTVVEMVGLLRAVVRDLNRATTEIDVFLKK